MIPANTPAQVAYAEGERDLRIASDSLSQVKGQAQPTCAEYVLECQLEQGHLQFILKSTTGTHEPRALLIRGLAAKQAAIESFLKLRQLPESPEVHILQSHILQQQDHYKESTSELRRALALTPSSKAVQLELAASLFLEENYSTNLAELTRLCLSNPQSAKLNFFVGHSLFETQQLEQSLPYLERALKFDPKLIPAQVSLGLTLARLGRFEQAIPHLQIALPLDRDGALYYQLSRAYQATQQPRLAQQMMAEYQKRQPHQ